MSKKVKPNKNSSRHSPPVDINLVKSGLRGVFKNKIQLVAFFCLFFFTAVLASGFSGFSYFLKDQNTALNSATNPNFPDVVVETSLLSSMSMPNYLDSYGSLASCSQDDSENTATDRGYEFANCEGENTSKYRLNYDNGQGSNFVDYAIAMEKAVRDKYQGQLKNADDFPVTFSLVARKSVVDKEFTYESFPINMMLPQYNQNIMTQFPDDNASDKLKRNYWSNMWEGTQNFVTNVAQFESKQRKFISQYDLVDIQKLFDNTGSPTLVEGRLPINKFEIGMNPFFAKTHDISLGDDWTISGLSYKVVGYFTTSEFMYPQFGYSNLTPSNVSQSQIFFPDNYYNAAFGNYFATITFADIKPTFYLRVADEYRDIIKADDLVGLLQGNPQINRSNEGGGVSKSAIFGSDLDRGIVEISKLDGGSFAQRTTFLGSIVDIMNKLFIGVIILVAVVIIIVSFVVIKKMIEDEGKEVGVLKSLGHSNSQIAFMYVVVPLVISAAACLLGIFTGSLFWTIGIDILNRYFNFSIVSAYSAAVYKDVFSANLLPIFASLFLPIIFSGISSYGISSLLLLKSPIRLLKRS